MATVAPAPAVAKVGKHRVTVTTILEEMMKAEQLTSPEMVTLASQGQISTYFSKTEPSRARTSENVYTIACLSICVVKGCASPLKWRLFGWINFWL